MSEEYLFVRKLDLGKEVVSKQPNGNGCISGRWNEMKTGGWFANILKKDLERLLRLISNDSS